MLAFATFDCGSSNDICKQLAPVDSFVLCTDSGLYRQLLWAPLQSASSPQTKGFLPSFLFSSYYLFSSSFMLSTFFSVVSINDALSLASIFCHVSDYCLECSAVSFPLIFFYIFELPTHYHHVWPTLKAYSVNTTWLKWPRIRYFEIQRFEWLTWNNIYSVSC